MQNKAKNVLSKITTISSEQQSQILNTIDNFPEKDIDLIVTKRQYKPKEEFCFYFVTNMKKLVIDPEIKLQDIRVIAVYAEKMAYGNQMNISQQDIADELGIAKTRVCETVRKLLKKGVVYKEGRSLYMNWEYLAKGNLKDFANARKQIQNLIEDKATSVKIAGCTTTQALFFLTSFTMIAAQLATLVTGV